MTYREALTEARTRLAADPAVVYLGYGIAVGNSAGGTLKGVPLAQRIECPVAENLMAGLAIGLSLKGKKPVVYFERSDFILNALDAIVNHLDKIATMSKGQFTPAAIITVVVGNTTKPLYTGATHTQCFADAIEKMVRFTIARIRTPEEVLIEYADAYARLEQGQSTMIFEYKDLI